MSKASAMNKKRFCYTAIPLFVMLTFTSIFGKVAQGSINVICGSPTPQPWQNNLPGTYFHVIESPHTTLGNSNYRFEAVSASGSRVYDVPFSRQTSLNLYTPRVSPDGRYMVFRPTSSKVGLTVWDLQTNAVASLSLQPD